MDHEGDYIKRLSDAVAIKSVSAWKENRDDIFKIVQETGKVRNCIGAVIG